MDDLLVVGLVFFELFLPPLPRSPAPGEELFVDRLPVGLGGAMNSASVARALGATVRLCAPLGQGLTDAGVRLALEKLGIAAVDWPGTDDAAISVVLSSPSDRSFISAVDAAALLHCPPLPPARFIHVGGLREARVTEARLRQARAAGAKISVSTCYAPEEMERLQDGVARPWDYLFMNEDEARRLAGSPERALEDLGHLAPNRIVTRGPAGAIAWIDGVSVEVSAVPAQVLDPTGAGDAFAAGTLVGRCRGLPPKDALALGASAAARILTVRGGVADRELMVQL
ncbi:MAG: PfkB family carbohydrate kinase [Myxococcota bacterium]